MQIFSLVTSQTVTSSVFAFISVIRKYDEEINNILNRP